jgi:capsular exopolysaccharide synthesis family protein
MEEKPAESHFRGVLSAPGGTSLTVAAAVGSPSLTVETFGEKLIRGKWLVLCTTAGFTLLAMMIGALQPPLYKTQTSIEIQSPERNHLLDQASDQVSAQDASLARESFLETQIRIIEIRSLVERALAKLSDDERLRLLDTPHFWWTRAADEPAESIRQRISAKSSAPGAGAAGIVDVSFLSPDAAVGARFLNVLTRELAEFNIEHAWHVLQHNRQWTERQVDELRQRWEQSEQVLAEYTQAAGLGKGPVPQMTQGAHDLRLRPLRNKLAELNKQIAQWETLYGPSGDTVQKLKAEAARTEVLIHQRMAAAVPQTQVLTPAPAITGSAQAVAHWHGLQKEAESNRIIYETTAARLKAAGVLTAAQLGDISVVDPAVPAAALATPSRFVTGTLGAFMGALLGCAFVALRDRLSNTFSEPAVMGHYLGLPVLGAIPVGRLPQDRNTYDAVNQEPALQLNFETDFATTEAFRTIRSSLLLRASQKAGPRRIVFTSASSAEGTTFVVGNLGAALASAQRRVLLVDGNLRNPGLHKIFGADNGHGLSDLLSRQIGESSLLSRDVIRQTQIPDLYLLSAGQAGTRAPEILSSAQLPPLIHEFAKGFDLVLVDAAPLLPYADTRSVARAVDGVVLIVRADSTNRHKAMAARDVVAQDGSPIIGAILTEWDAALSASA